MLFVEDADSITNLLPDTTVEWYDYEEEVFDYNIEFVSDTLIKCIYTHEGIRKESNNVVVSYAIPYPVFAQSNWSEVKAVCVLRSQGRISDEAWSAYISIGEEKSVLFDQEG
jgi:hypothetical protein